jgi:DNA-binding NtrC family response regulator
MKNNLSNPLLIIDDESNVRNSFKLTLMNGGYSNIITTDKTAEVLNLIRTHDIGVVLLDFIMPEISGDELLKKILRAYPELVVIIITGISNMETAIKCIKGGAFDYIVKPVDAERLIVTVDKAMEMFELRRENSLIKENFLDRTNRIIPAFSHIVTNNEDMKNLFKYSTAISKTNRPVLICGETGVGKELFAKAIHNLSARQGSFVPVNVAGVDSHVFIDTLYGHIKGAFTGAGKDRKGLIEKAEKGSIFLDEIGDLNHECQVKLLRLLQEKEYMPLGSDDYKTADVRIIAATNKDLKTMAAYGSFREDLYYRLKTHQINIPPLRERLDDIEYLLNFFLKKAFSNMNRKTPTYPQGLITLLKNYNYPGNIREFIAMIDDIAARHNSKILSMKPFEQYIGISAEGTNNTATSSDEQIIYPEKLPTLDEANTSIIKEALKRADNNQSLAARLLGISQQTFNYRLKKNKRLIPNSCIFIAFSTCQHR